MKLLTGKTVPKKRCFAQPKAFIESDVGVGERGFYNAITLEFMAGKSCIKAQALISIFGDILTYSFMSTRKP